MALAAGFGWNTLGLSVSKPAASAEPLTATSVPNWSPAAGFTVESVVAGVTESDQSRISWVAEAAAVAEVKPKYPVCW